MGIYAQHGYGKSDRVEQGLRLGVLDGVILSPKDEKPDSLECFAQSIRHGYPNATVLLDPQFYVSTITPARERYLVEYDSYYRSSLSRKDFISPITISAYVKNTIDYQMSLPLTHLVSPSIMFDDFQDPWSQTCLSLAESACHYHSTLGNPRPLMLSVVFSEVALASAHSLGQFLDILSTFEATGFYLIVRRTGLQYQPQMEPNYLANLLYLIYVLAEINKYEVVMGYTDILGLLFHSVGAKAIGCGWFNSLRQFSLASFQPSSGGGKARARYTSIPLLNSILVVPELQSAYQAGLIDSVLTGTSLDVPLRSNPANAAWSAEMSTLHHWAALHETVTRLLPEGGTSERLASISKRIENARDVYKRLRRHGSVFEPASGPGHLEQWQRAIDDFVKCSGV